MAKRALNAASYAVKARLLPRDGLLDAASGETREPPLMIARLLLGGTSGEIG